nr:hypothetical protein [Tanacetum cinerariifolium]
MQVKLGRNLSLQYVLLPLWSTCFKDPQNSDADAAFADKENESEVHVSPRRVRDLSDEFEEFFVNNNNWVNAASASFTGVGPNLTNNINSFITAGPSDNAVSPTFEIGEKYSFMDPSQYPDDPNMPTLEDIVYSDDEEDVAAEADFSNLGTSITVSPIPTTIVRKDHPVTQIIEPKRVHQALKDPSWIEAMQEKLLQCNMQKFQGLKLSSCFYLMLPLWAFWYIKWMSKVRFFMEPLKKKFMFVQPPGFEDPDYPNKVYKVVKALYGLHQAHRAWYETLANYLLENSFQRGKIDQTLFIKKQKGDILLVQVYVDDIIFGSTNKELCKAFEKLMKDKFQMSLIGELTFFLGLQVKKKDNGIFISHDTYVDKILRKFGHTYGKLASTPIDTEKPLLMDPDGEDVDVHIYRSMISSLMYLTSSRPDIMFAVCTCAYFQVTTKASHLHAVNRIFRYLKGKPHLGLWYPKDSPFNLVAYSDSDYSRASLDRKSTTGGY